MTDPTEVPPSAPRTVTIPLQEPLQREAGPIAAITLRKPRAGELRGLKLGELINSDVGAVITLLPRISDPFITPEEAANLDAEDIAEIAGVIVGFFLTPAQKAMIQQMAGS